MNAALLMIDVQNDFCEGGALAVPKASEIIPVINALQTQFSEIIATRDWHPPHHQSFATMHPGAQVGETIYLSGQHQVLWPVHCVQQTEGAAFHPHLKQNQITKIIDKGLHEAIDSYSAFFDNAKQHQTELHDYLQSKSISTLYLTGLATDYCVLFTCLDACQLGYQVKLVMPGCRAVKLNQGDEVLALQTMQAAGAELICKL